jgi:hypothetical protein
VALAELFHEVACEERVLPEWGGAPRAEDGTSWWTRIMVNAMLSFSAGCFNSILRNMSDNGARRYLSHSSNASPQAVTPLKSLSWKKRSSAATNQATLKRLSVLSAFGINSFSSLFFLLLPLLMFSFLTCASHGLICEARSLKGDWKALTHLGGGAL